MFVELTGRMFRSLIWRMTLGPLVELAQVRFPDRPQRKQLRLRPWNVSKRTRWQFSLPTRVCVFRPMLWMLVGTRDLPGNQNLR